MTAGLSEGIPGQVPGNPSTSGNFVLRNGAGNKITLAPPNSGLTDYGLTFPATAGGISSMIYLSNGTGSLAWLSAGTNGQVLTINVSGVPAWTTGSGNFILNGTSLQTGNFNISGNGTIDGQLQLKGSGTGITTFQSGAQNITNINYTLPIVAPTANQVLISSGGAASNLSWTDASSLLSGSYWSLSGNNTSTAYNGTTGSFLGTTSTQPLVFATTNIVTPQPIKLLTNNTERMRIGSDGNIGIGITSASSILHIATSSTVDDGNDLILAAYNSTANNGGEFVTQRAEGTLASPLNVAIGDDLGGMKFRGYFNGSFIESGQLDFIVDGTPLSSGIATHVILNTSDGSSMTQRLYVGSNGNVAVGAVVPNTKLDVEGAIALRPSIPAAITANTTITVGNRSYIRLTHGANAATYTISLSGGLQDGQTLIIQFENVDGTHPFQFTDGGNLMLSGNFVPNTSHSTISLIWDGSEWVETARSLN